MSTNFGSKPTGLPNTAENLKNTAEDTVQNTSNKIRNIRDEAKEGVQGLRDGAQDIMDQAKPAIREGLEQGQKMGQDFLNRGKDLTGSISQSVQTSPWEVFGGGSSCILGIWNVPRSTSIELIERNLYV